MALGVYGSRRGQGSARAFESCLGLLAGEGHVESNVFGRARRMFSSSSAEEEYAMKDIVLNKSLGERVRSLSGAC